MHLPACEYLYHLSMRPTAVSKTGHSVSATQLSTSVHQSQLTAMFKSRPTSPTVLLPSLPRCFHNCPHTLCFLITSTVKSSR